jgi:filamentous hemagglutinin
MPQVYLPLATQGALAGGVIQGNQVTLTATGTGDADHPNGTVTNTGFISAQQLIINAGELNNEARNADIGVQTYRTDKQGYTKVTGDEVQPGGFLSAVNYQLNVDRVNSISGQFQQLNADGTVNQAGSQALLDGLKQQLGTDFTQSTAQNHIQQEWVQTKKSDPTEQIVIIAAAIALSIITAGTAGVALAGAIGATGVTGAAVAAAVGAMASSAFTQLATTGSLDLGTTFEAGAIGGITAGLTQGITYDAGSLGMTNSLTDPNSLANLGGAQSVGNGLTGSTVTQAGTSTATTLGTRVGAAVADSAISAGVQTIISGGSFGNALKNNLIGAAAAAGANFIGSEAPAYSLASVSEHALLGCAAASLGGNSCAAGAIGGATSALVAPMIRDGLYNNQDTTTTVNNGDGTQTTTTTYSNTIYNAVTTALATLAGGGIAAALGQNATVAANAATNEAINNANSTKSWVTAVPVVGLLMTPFGPVPMVGALPIGGLGIPGKPSFDQQLEALDGLLPPSTNQSGLFTNTGTTLPAWLGDLGNSIMGLPNQLGQWANTLLTHPSSCVGASALFCGGLGLILSVGNGPSSTTSTIANNSSVGKEAERDVQANFVGQGVTVQPQVSLVSGSTRAVADLAVNGAPNATVQVPPGYVAEGLNGNALADSNGHPITSFNLNSQGQAIVEVKTGGASLTTNQAGVYPAAQSGTASGTGAGTNAARAAMDGSLPPTPVIILRKK